MLRFVRSLFLILSIVVLVGCQLHRGETMVLLDEKIAKVSISKSNGFGEMNEEIIHSFTDDESINIFQEAITTAQKQIGKVDLSEPEYDVMVGYTSTEGQLPTHAIHLWLGNENEKSIFMYLEDDEVFYTTPKITEQLRMLIHLGN